MTTEEFTLLADALGVAATAFMLFLTTRHTIMTEKPLPQDFAESVVGNDEQRIHEMLNDAMENQYDISTWTVDDIVADLLAYADLEDSDTEESLRVHIITWKANRMVPT
jgi:hypothetical protein